MEKSTEKHYVKRTEANIAEEWNGSVHKKRGWIWSGPSVPPIAELQSTFMLGQHTLKGQSTNYKNCPRPSNDPRWLLFCASCSNHRDMSNKPSPLPTGRTQRRLATVFTLRPVSFLKNSKWIKRITSFLWDVIRTAGKIYWQRSERMNVIIMMLLCCITAGYATPQNLRGTTSSALQKLLGRAMCCYFISVRWSSSQWINKSGASGNLRLWIRFPSKWHFYEWTSKALTGGKINGCIGYG